ncbi:MAG: metal-dependent transcriptional regulator [Micrococcales bacterium]|nr:metal-dependent transcriptional regulator [Micrococcales bacterium]
MTDLIDTTEMYLRTLLELEEEGTPLLRARIAERLGHSGPTVSQTVARMERDGLVHLQPDRSLVFSQEGRQRATRVMRKHRLAERLLLDVIGLEYEHVHQEACRWEHVMSERVERKILDLLTEHAASPYGNPIPGLEELGGLPQSARPAGLVHLTELASQVGSSGTVRLRRLGEPLQTDEDLLAALSSAEVLPDRCIAYVVADTGRIIVRGVAVPEDAGVDLPPAVAALLFVTPG